MIIEVDIKRADQSWNLETKTQQNFLVLDVLGVEVRAPCTEEQLVYVIRAMQGEQPVEEAESEDDELYEQEEPPPALPADKPRQAPATFRGEPQQVPVQVPSPGVPAIMAAPPARPVRQLKPIGRARKRGDDAGISQG